MSEREELDQTIAALESQRAILGDAVVDASIAALRAKLAALEPAGAPTPVLHGERRLVTVLFADISGFTALSERLDAEVVRDLVNACFECLVPVVGRYEGTVDKFIGDEIMALFGAPVAHEDDAVHALRAALEMQDQLATFNLQHSTDLGIHFGINTGHVIAGGLGTRERQEYSVMGDAVNVAARLEDASQRGEILVGADTYRLTAPLFEFEALEPVVVKGKVEPVPVYRLLGAREVHGKVRGIEGLESALVGRAREVRTLLEAVDRLRAGVGGIVTVVGEAGLGKSRLVAELQGMTQHETRDIEWVEGRCLSYGGTIAYLPWLDVLRGLLGVQEDNAPRAVRDVLRAHCCAVCPDGFDDVYPFLVRLLSLPPDDETETRLRGIEAEGLQVLTFRAVMTLVECTAWGQPLALVCEDLHWADATSLALLEHVLALADRAPLLVICVFRPETEHGCWRIKEMAARLYHHRHTDLWIEPLSADESAVLVGNLLHVEGLPTVLRSRILGRGEGNPFYVEEIIRSLIDSGAIVHDEATGRWQAMRDVAEIALPDTLHGVLAARIDRLQEETRRVLQLASVVGRAFLYRVLAEIAREERALDTRLLTLQREQLIRERVRVPELEYVFKHELTREAAYNGLLLRERRAYHRQVAGVLEQLFPERLEELLGTLAYHWERAGDVEQAFSYLRRAGEQAAAQYANDEAVAYFSRALDLLPEERREERFLLLLAREGALDLQGRRDAQREDLAALEALAEILADPCRQADVALHQAHYAARTQDYRAAADAAQAAIRRAESAGDIVRQAAAHRELGRAFRYLAAGQQTEPARVELERALHLARAAGSRQVEVDTLHELGAMCEDLDRERRYFEEQLRLCRETGNRRDEGRALRDLGSLFIYLGQYLEARTYFECSLNVCQQTGNRRDEGWALHCLGEVYVSLGDYATALTYSEQALRVHRETGDQLGELWTCKNFVDVSMFTGDYTGARNWIAQMEQITDWIFAFASHLGDLAWAQGNLEGARAQYEKSLQTNVPENSSWYYTALCGLASVALAEGDLAQAERRVAQIRPILGKSRWAISCIGLRSHLICYRVLHASGDPHAQEILEGAYRLLQERAVYIDDEALRRSYLENVPAHREIVAEYEQRSARSC